MLHDQLLHLIQVAQLPNVTVQVLPFAAGAIMGGPLPFLTYRFPPPSGLDVVLLESLASHAYLEDPSETAPYDNFFNHLRAAAMSALDSEAFIADIANELPQS